MMAHIIMRGRNKFATPSSVLCSILLFHKKILNQKTARCNIFSSLVCALSEVKGMTKIMKAIPQISESELEVMKILWEVGESTSADIVEVLTKQTDWKPKTVYTLINRLVAKGAINAEKTDGKAYLYIPTISEIDYQEFANNSFLQKVYNGSVKMMLTSFVKEPTLKKLNNIREYDSGNNGIFKVNCSSFRIS